MTDKYRVAGFRVGAGALSLCVDCVERRGAPTDHDAAAAVMAVDAAREGYTCDDCNQPFVDEEIEA